MIAFLFNGLWQGAIVVALAALLARYAARESAATRYAIWMLSLVGIVAIPAITLLAPLHLLSFQHTLSSAPARLRFTLVEANALSATSSVAGWIVGLWGCGVAAMLLRLAASALRIERVRRNATPLLVASHAVLVSDEISMPIAAGVFSPVIILPRALVERLAHDDLGRVIAHERAHIARHDVAANYLQKVVEAALFFNPWVHAIASRLTDEREAACDDLAVVVTGESHDYAALLASLAQTIARRPAPLVSPSVFGSRRALIARIERLLDGASHTVRFNYAAVVATIAAFTAITFALELFSPAVASTAQEPSAAAAPFSAAPCARPDTSVAVAQPAMPNLPEDSHPSKPVIVRVGVSPHGKPTDVTLVKSSGDELADRAVVQSARESTYAPATRDCKSVAGSYLFRADFKPNHP